MAFCKECGTKIDDGVKFCPSCGTPITSASETVTPASEKATPSEKTAPTERAATAPTSAADILNKTKPFLIVRALAQVAIMAVMLVIGIIGVWIIYLLWGRELYIPAYIVGIVIFGGFFGLLRFAKRYFLYMIKAAHVAAITEYIKTGAVPVTENGYKGVMAYGTEKIKNNFKEANIAFVADALIAAASKQIMHWLNKALDLFSFIPGAANIKSFINLVLSTALNYIDEAVLSYVFYHNEESNGFKKACDGLVYYAQSWKGMLMGALKVAALIWILRIVAFIILLLLFIPLGQMVSPIAANVVALVLSLIILYGLEEIIVVPYATCVMINDYYKAIEGQPLKADLHGKLCKVSKKFRELWQKSDQPLPAEPATMPTSL